MNALKKLFYPLYKFFTCKSFRELIFFELKNAKKSRYKHYHNLKFNQYTFDIVDIASTLGQLQEIFIDEIYLFESKSKTPLIIDCGANIGLSCIYFKKIHPRSNIIAFEPDLNIYRVLQDNLKKCKIKGVQINNSAIWKHNNGVTFNYEGADGGAITESGLNKVKSTRLKNLLTKYDKIDFLKIDIEGAEYDVLNDCRNLLYKADKIFIEYHSQYNSNQKLDKILEILSQNSFRYLIQNNDLILNPYMTRRNDSLFDLQLNIFAYKA